MKMNFKKIAFIGLLTCAGLFTSSCLGDDDSDGPSTEQTGFVAFYNVSPGSSALSFYKENVRINPEPLNYNFLYGYDFQPIGENVYTVRASSNLDLDTLTLNIEQNKYYSIYAVNDAAHTELVAYNDEFYEPPHNKSLIRFIQLSHNLPTIKIDLDGAIGNLGATYDFKQATPFMEVTPGANKIIYLIDSETNDTIFSKTVSLSGGGAYSIISEGIYGSDNENLDLDIQVSAY